MDIPEDKNERDESRFAALHHGLGRARQHAGRIIGITVLALVVGLGIFGAGYHFGSAPRHSTATTHELSPDHDFDAMPPTTPRRRICDAPSPLSPGKEIPEPTETAPPTEPCVTPNPDIVVLVGASKAKALPAVVGGVDCEMSGDFDPDYSACDPRPASDVEALAKKLLTPEQLAFVNDHVVSTEDAYWAFDIKDTATLQNQYMVPGASYDESINTITVYIW